MDLFPSSALQQRAPQNPAGPGLAERWRAWMQKPENAAMLMQSGIAMLQPLQLGQSTAGAIASSIGQGFEARDRVRANAAANSQQQLENTQKQQQVDAAVRSDTARAKYQESLGSRSGVSASSLFSRENRRHDRLQNYLIKAAESATEMIFDPDEKSNRMLELLNDQAWLDQQAAAFMATDATSERILTDGPATPAVPRVSSSVPIPPAAIERLRGNPALARDFDEKFGIGAAARILGGQ